MKAFVIAEYDIHEVIEYRTSEQLEWFRQGVDAGSSAYGSGSCHVISEADLEGDTLTEVFGLSTKTAEKIRVMIQNRLAKNQLAP